MGTKRADRASSRSSARPSLRRVARRPPPCRSHRADRRAQSRVPAASHVDSRSRGAGGLGARQARRARGAARGAPGPGADGAAGRGRVRPAQPRLRRSRRRRLRVAAAPSESATIGIGVQDSSGTQFRVIDPPRVSPSPVAPNRARCSASRSWCRWRPASSPSFLASQVAPTFHDARVCARSPSGRSSVSCRCFQPAPFTGCVAGARRSSRVASSGLLASFLPRSLHSRCCSGARQPIGGSHESDRTGQRSGWRSCGAPERHDRRRGSRRTGNDCRAAGRRHAHARRPRRPWWRAGRRRATARRCCAPASAPSPIRRRLPPSPPSRRRQHGAPDILSRGIPWPRRSTSTSRGSRRAAMSRPMRRRSQIADEFRVIKRPIIRNALGRAGAKVRNGNLVMVTSALPGEGKTFTALNLAMSVAMEYDNTVLLVDGDVAHPGLPKLTRHSAVAGSSRSLDQRQARRRRRAGQDERREAHGAPGRLRAPPRDRAAGERADGEPARRDRRPLPRPHHHLRLPAACSPPPKRACSRRTWDRSSWSSPRNRRRSTR